MENLVILRHGAYDDEAPSILNPLGRHQMQRMRRYLESLNLRGIVLTSPSGRARESADILGGESPSVIIIPELYEPNQRVLDWRLELIHEEILRRWENSQDVIVVSHKPIVQRYPTYFALKAWGKKIEIPPPEASEGVWLKIKEKDYQYLRC